MMYGDELNKLAGQNPLAEALVRVMADNPVEPGSGRKNPLNLELAGGKGSGSFTRNIPDYYTRGPFPEPANSNAAPISMNRLQSILAEFERRLGIMPKGVE